MAAQVAPVTAVHAPRALAGRARPGRSISGGGWSWQAPVREPPAACGPAASALRANARAGGGSVPPLRRGGPQPCDQTLRTPRHEALAPPCPSAARAASARSASPPVGPSQTPLSCSGDPAGTAPSSGSASGVAGVAEALKEELLSSLRSELCSSAVLESLRELRADMSSALAAVRGRLDEDLHRLLGEMEQVKAELHGHKDPTPDGRADLGGLQDDLKALREASLAGFAPLQEGLTAFRSASQTELATLAKQMETLTTAVGQLPADIHSGKVDVHPISNKMDEARAQMDLSAVLAEIRQNRTTVEVELRAIREKTSQMDTAAIATEIRSVRGELQAAIPRLAAEVQEGKMDLAQVLAELRAVRDSSTRLDGKLGHNIKEVPAGEVNLSIDVTRGDDVLSGVGLSTIQTPGSSFAFVDLQSSRILSDSVLCPAASECGETDDLAEEGTISGVQCSQLDKALWELR